MGLLLFQNSPPLSDAGSTSTGSFICLTCGQLINLLYDLDYGLCPIASQLSRTRLVGVEVEGAGLTILGEHIFEMFGFEIVKCITVSQVYILILVGNLYQYIRIGYHSFLSRHKILRGVVGIGTIPDRALQYEDGVGAQLAYAANHSHQVLLVILV